MADAGVAVLQLRAVIKDYRSLRPLRVQHLDVRRGESVALLGFDESAAEVLVNLLTAGAVPDSGEVVVFGQPTTAIADRDSWLRTLDHFGLVSERSVLLEQLTAEQNLAMPLSLTVESMPDELRRQARSLAEEIGLDESVLRRRTGELDPPMRLRVRLGRALALDPDVILAEHPNATLTPGDARAFAADLRRIAARRGAATVVMTADREFARAAARQVLVLEPSTGELKPIRNWLRFPFC
jgi:putative ABC transport system ATP-binding protein